MMILWIYFGGSPLHWTIFLVISLCYRVLFKVKVQNGNIFLSMLKFQIFWGYACPSPPLEQDMVNIRHALDDHFHVAARCTFFMYLINRN